MLAESPSAQQIPPSPIARRGPSLHSLDQLNAALTGRYTVDREIGAGGMATVFLGHDIKHDRDVAIKVLHPDLGAALGAERFLTEIKTTAKLQHPHILPLLDSGAAEGLLYYVMPLVTGEKLRARLEHERQLPIAEALRIAREVAGALDYAHRQGVIHRDIKPENILLHDGSALVADFGISLAVQTAGGQRMTQTGLSLGTPQYMSPEQAMGERSIDARSDIYALGAVLYEMLAGDAPFIGSSVQAIVAKVLNEKPTPLHTLRDTVPESVEEAVLTALAKLPADRHATAAAFSAALESTSATSVSSGARRAAFVPTRAAMALRLAPWALASALAVALVLQVGNRESSREGAAFQLVPMPPSTGTLAMSPDGLSFVAGSVDSAGLPILVLRSLVGAAERSVHPGPVVSVAFSPDGRHLAYVDVATLSLIVQDLNSSAVRTLASGRLPRGLAWVSNDALVISTQDGGATQYRLSGSSQALVKSDSPDSIAIVQLAAASDGVLIARANRGGQGLFVAISKDGQQIDSLYGPLSGLTRLRVVGDVLLFTEAGRLWGIPLASGGRKTAGERREVLGAAGPSDVVNFAASRSGSLLVLRFAGTSDRELILVGRDGRVTPAVPQRAAYRGPRYSPDGSRISALRSSGNQGPLWLTDLTRGTGQWAGSDSLVYAQQWTPDGRSLLTVTRRAGRTSITSIAAEGGGTPTTLLEQTNPIYELAISPDGRTLVWREDAPTSGRDIRMASLDRPSESQPVRVSNWDERGIALSQDGKWLAFTSNESGGTEVLLCRLEPNGPRWVVTRGGGAEPRWGPNGELFYRNRDSVFVLRVSGSESPLIGKPSLVAVVPAITGLYEQLWDVRRDGQQFVVVRQLGAERREQFLVLNWEQRWREAMTQQ